MWKPGENMSKLQIDNTPKKKKKKKRESSGDHQPSLHHQPTHQNPKTTNQNHQNHQSKPSKPTNQNHQNH